MDSDPSGRIITFYSYKGGTGRTMALANTAWVLASNGYRVLMIDWDLEAPGLHRYFHPFLSDKLLVHAKGMIDFMFDYQRSVLALPEQGGVRRFPDGWYEERLDVFRYITELQWRQSGFGELHLLPAGQQVAEYATRVNTFNWRQLYENLGGFHVFEAMKRQLAREYDFVLVDSRTGVSDTSGICTVQMPDVLVVCFTLNSQSIEGAGEVAISVAEQRQEDYDQRRLRVFPVPTRLEKAEKQKLDLARDAARTKFDTFLTDLSPADRERYWGEVEMFYEPFYAYEEVLAAFADKPGTINSLLASIERLTARVTEGRVSRMQSLPADQRLAVLSQYERSQRTPSDAAAHAAAVFKRLGAQQEDVARNVLLRLVSPGVGDSAFRAAMATRDFPEHERGIVRRLIDEGILTRKLAGDGDTEYVVIADDHLIDSWPALRGWIQEQAKALRVRRLLEDRATQWDAEGRPAGLALSASELPDAKRAIGDSTWATPLVLAFVNESEDQGVLDEARRRETAKQLKRARWWTYGVTAVALILGIGYLGAKYVLPRISDFLILRNVQTKTNKIDEEKYVWIEPGDFVMGCSYEDTAGCDSVSVTIKPGFWMGQTEVTGAAWRRFLAARHPERREEFPADKFPARYPASVLTWLDAYEYCAWAGGALPSDAQWEYAARAKSRGRRYITGDTLVEERISLGDKPKPVGSYSPNQFGLLDMSGNVAEWVDDISDYYPFGFRRSGGGPLQNPHNSPSERLRNPYFRGVTSMSTRGGSYDSVARDLRLDAISPQLFNHRDPRIGFRCIIPASDLDTVASNYQPFAALYGAYTAGYRPYFWPYEAWWYNVYIRYLNEAGRK